MKPLPFPLRVAAGLAVTAAERARELPKDLVGLPVTVASQVLQFTMRLQQHVTELAIKGDEVLSMLRPAEEAPSWATFDEDLPPVEPTSTGSNGRPRATAVRDPWEDEERALAEDHTDGEFDTTFEKAGVDPGEELNGTAIDAELESLLDAGKPSAAGDSAPGTDSALDDTAQDRPATSADDAERAADAEGTTGTDGAASAQETGDAGASGGNTGDAGASGGNTGATGAPSGTGNAGASGGGTSTPSGDAGAPSGNAAGPIGVPNYDELTLPQLRARLRRFSLEELEEMLAYERDHENRPSFVGMLARRIGNVQRTPEGDDPSGA